MSDSLALVRFPDGELRVAYWFGGPGLVVPLLHQLDEAEELWSNGLEHLLERLGDLSNCELPFDVEDVEIWADYGEGLWWQGRASRSCGLIVSGVDPGGVAQAMGELGAESKRELLVGIPDWVPDAWRPRT